MIKPKRTIFQPDVIADFFIRGYMAHTDGTVGDIVNSALYRYFIPRNKLLYREVEPLLYRIRNNEPIAEAILQGTLARSVSHLSAYPINDCHALEQISYKFTSGYWMQPRYDYILLVDQQTDRELQRLNEILKTIDPSYNLSMHELGERTRSIFNHWNELCGYGEIYRHLANIFRLENTYMGLDTYDTIVLVKQLDEAIIDSPAMPIAGEFPVSLTKIQRIYGVKNEILMYLTDNAYVALSGDASFSHMSPEIKEYYQDLHNTMSDSKERDPSQYDDYYEDLLRLKEKGLRLFKDLGFRSRYENK